MDKTMMDRAISKFKSEMNDKNPYIKIIGNYLIEYVKSNPETAEKFLSENKTIKKSFDEMEKVARTRRFGNVAVLTDPEGYDIVLSYFGVKSPSNITQNEISVPNTPTNEISDEVSKLEELKKLLEEF